MRDAVLAERKSLGDLVLVEREVFEVAVEVEGRVLESGLAAGRAPSVEEFFQWQVAPQRADVAEPHRTVGALVQRSHAVHHVGRPPVLDAAEAIRGLRIAPDVPRSQRLVDGDEKPRAVDDLAFPLPRRMVLGLCVLTGELVHRPRVVEVERVRHA